MVFAGGGMRFGIYLGMHAAACDAGRAPDVLLASCGGALAAAIVQGLPDDRQRKAWLASPAMHAFWRDLQPGPQAGIARLLARAARRRLDGRAAPLVPDLFGDYLFEAPMHLPLPSGAASAGPTLAVAVAVIGGRLLFGQGDVGRPRAGRKLVEETVFGDARTAALLQGMASPFAASCWGEHAIASGVAADVAMPLGTACRLSIADFFYFRCVAHAGQHYIGGVVDLFPIEVARRLAGEVLMEFKQPFDQALSIPAWRAVLGLDGNQRLRHVHAEHADAWIDSSDVRSVLARQQVHRTIDWRRNRIGLHVPADHATYARHIEDQWQYGYARAAEALRAAAAGAKATMRNVNLFNRARPCAS
ncbi:MAG: hypothetical protein JWQ88_1277 [Rhodoferax sp.]|nr:hypothetical protein [Rhodoferax sp.]